MNTILFPVDFIENQIQPPDLKRICRICMGCSPVMSDIFMDVEGQPVNEFIMECFPVRIQPGEKLPELICSPCLEKLVIVRQFRILCLHSDRCLRTELSNLLQTQSSFSVLPVSNLPTSNETFIDSSGNQVILVTNHEHKNQQFSEEEEQTYYILHEDGGTYQTATAAQVKNEENLILIDDDEEEIPEGTVVVEELPENNIVGEEQKEEELVLSDIVHENGKRITDEEVPRKKKKHRTNLEASSNNNSPEFQFVDINDSAQITSDENLIEILEDENGETMDMKVCGKCGSSYATSLLNHNLVCSSNFRDCQFCGLSDLNVIQFDKHIMDMHIKEYRVCPKCRYVFLEERHFLHHNCKHFIVVDFDVNNYTCAFCLESFNNLQAFTHHYYKEHHKKTNCSCNKHT